MIKKKLTLCLIQKGNEILLGMKKRGFGAGRWNGFGGKMETGETLEDAAMRECYEEAKIAPFDIQKVGIIDFKFKASQDILEVHIFKAENFDGEPTETEEMRPQWFNFSKIPFDSMWPDDKFWIPLFLQGKKFKGEFIFDGNDKIVGHALDVVEKL